MNIYIHMYFISQNMYANHIYKLKYIVFHYKNDMLQIKKIKGICNLIIINIKNKERVEEK